jgi:pyridoxal phosphate phosphatase PHOSPHO2
VMEGMLQELSAAAAAGMRRPSRVVYLGDGRGDYCPTLKLAERDYMMPRKGYPVWDLIAGDRRAVRADVRGWADFKDLETVLLDIIHECAAAAMMEQDGGDQVVVGMVVPECRALSAPKMAMAVLPKAIHAPN